MHFSYFHKIFENIICIYGNGTFQALKKDILKGLFFITVFIKFGVYYSTGGSNCKVNSCMQKHLMHM